MEYIDIALNPKRILNHLFIIKEKEKLLVNNEYKNKKLIRAGHVELQLTDRCQLNCTHCHFRGMGDYDFKID